MKNLKGKTSENTFVLFGLTIATAGLYYLYYLIKNRQAIVDELGEEALPQGLFKTLVIVWGVADLCGALSLALLPDRSAYKEAVALANFGGLFNFAITVILIILAFKTKAAIENKTNQRVSGAATFFFTFFYINDVINKDGERSNSSATVKSQESNLEDLARYNELLQQGILTQEEFDAKKKEILAI